jgi:hypothetical protein
MRKNGYSADLGKHVSMANIGRRVRFHDLRHTHASHLLQGSWGRKWMLSEIAQMLGHSSVNMTTRYAHLSEGGIAQAVRETNTFNPAPAADAANPKHVLMRTMVAAGTPRKVVAEEMGFTYDSTKRICRGVQGPVPFPQ